MAKRANKHGQSLVELAVVLPCLCLGIFMGVQLICFCHNMVELQRMAQVTIDRQSPESSQTIRDYWLLHSLWGRFIDPRIKSETQMVSPWRSNRGVHTVGQAGWFRRIGVQMDLLPGAGFSRVLLPVKQEAFAETYFEPPIPSEE